MEKNKKEILMLIGAVVLYMISAVIQAITPASGIIAQVQVLVSVFMVAGLGKKGYIVAVCLNLIRGFISFLDNVVNKGTISVSLILPLITIVTITIIYVFSVKALKSKSELEKNNRELMEANRLMREKDETLTYLAYYDILTGLANRQLFIEHIDESVQENSKTPFTVIYFDIDNFKHINESYGHNTGDMVLSTYADRLRVFCGDSDFVAKLGGDEFAVILKGAVSENGVVSYIERLRNAVCKPVQVEGVTIQTSMSFGVASYPLNGANSQELLRSTDVAMYNAKANGKDRTCFYSNQAC